MAEQKILYQQIANTGGSPGQVLVANSTGVAWGDANNTAYLGGVAAANYIANTGNYTISGVHTHTANIIIDTTASISANNSFGTSGQVLTSNGTGGIYWGTGGGGGGGVGYTGSAGIDATGYTGSAGTVGYTGSAGSGGAGGSWTGGTMSNTAYFANTAESTNNVSGAVTILGGLGVSNNIYVEGRYGFANAANIGVVYTYYNEVLNSIDTVFG